MASERQLNLGQILRYLITGLASLAADLSALYVMHGLLGVWVVPASVASFAVAFVVNFSLNRWWTFGTASSPLVKHLGRYAVLVLVNATLTALIVNALTTSGVHYMAAKLAVTVVIVIGNFFVMSRWVFR